MNQLLRNTSHQARAQALAVSRARQQQLRPQFRPQGAPQPNVAGGCGPGGGWNQGGFPSPAGSADPWASSQFFEGLPQLAPTPGPGTVVSNLYRLGFIAATNTTGPRTIELAPPNGASLWVAGLLSLTPAFSVIIHSVEQGSLPFSPVVEVDAAVFATDECFCPIELGCSNNLTPLVFSFSAFGTPSVQPFLNMTAVGTWQGGFGTCGLPMFGYNSPVPTMPGAGPIF